MVAFVLFADSIGGSFPVTSHRCHHKQKHCPPVLPGGVLLATPLLFHPHTKGSQILMDLSHKAVKRQASFCNAITFSNRPVLIYEQVRLKVGLPSPLSVTASPWASEHYLTLHPPITAFSYGHYYTLYLLFPLCSFCCSSLSLLFLFPCPSVLLSQPSSHGKEGREQGVAMGATSSWGGKGAQMVGKLGRATLHGGGLQGGATPFPVVSLELGRGWAGLGCGLSEATPCRPDHQEAVLLEWGVAPRLHEQGPLPYPP